MSPTSSPHGAMMKTEPQSLLDHLKRVAQMMGYRIEVDPDGTERVIRPDGTVAVTAKGKPQP